MYYSMQAVKTMNHVFFLKFMLQTPPSTPFSVADLYNYFQRIRIRLSKKPGCDPLPLHNLRLRLKRSRAEGIRISNINVLWLANNKPKNTLLIWLVNFGVGIFWHVFTNRTSTMGSVSMMSHPR
jgi:hypothetical protein